ncbi:transcription factor IIF subunit tfg1 [Elasticomyces elasticus]|nr:transcription factor IIF subunit tfg1 [Elasticomyces elasticus]
MTASAAAPSPGSASASATPNSAPPNPILRKKKVKSNNLFISKRAQPAKPPPKPATNGTDSANGANGAPSAQSSRSVQPTPSMYAQVSTEAAPPVNHSSIYRPEEEALEDPSTYNDFPIVATKRELMDGLRFHAMRFISKDVVDPYDESVFTRPIRLHRRDPREVTEQSEPTPESVVDDKEREKEAIRKAEKQVEREANQAQIAPTKSSVAKKKNPFQKKTEDVWTHDDAASQKKAKLRYEEGRPWFLEDFDTKNNWVGNYEQPLSENHVLFIIEDGGFRMLPVEKWYRFAPTKKVKAMNLEDAEKHMERKTKEPRWFLRAEHDRKVKQHREQERQTKLMRARAGGRDEQRPIKNEDDDYRPEIANDVDEIDFDHDEEFQDDDEGKLIVGEDEEDVKDAERKIREEQRAANVFAGTGVKDEKDWDEEEGRLEREAREERKKERKLRKALIGHERKYEYDSDSDHPPSPTPKKSVKRQKKNSARKRRSAR